MTTTITTITTITTTYYDDYLPPPPAAPEPGTAGGWVSEDAGFTLLSTGATGVLP